MKRNIEKIRFIWKSITIKNKVYLLIDLVRYSYSQKRLSQELDLWLDTISVLKNNQLMDKVRENRKQLITETEKL